MLNLLASTSLVLAHASVQSPSLESCSSTGIRNHFDCDHYDDRSESINDLAYLCGWETATEVIDLAAKEHDMTLVEELITQLERRGCESAEDMGMRGALLAAFGE